MATTQPLVRWQNQYGSDGFTVISVYTEFSRSQDTLRNTKRYVDREGVHFPVVFDGLRVLRHRYGVSGAPSAYLLDTDGCVVWEGLMRPGKERRSLERCIRRELRGVKEGVF